MQDAGTAECDRKFNIMHSPSQNEYSSSVDQYLGHHKMNYELSSKQNNYEALKATTSSGHSMAIAKEKGRDREMREKIK